MRIRKDIVLRRKRKVTAVCQPMPHKKKQSASAECGSYAELKQKTAEAVNELLGNDRALLKRQRDIYEQLDVKRKELWEALLKCNLMNGEAKDYVKYVLREIVTERFAVSRRNIDTYLNSHFESVGGSICRFIMLLEQYENVELLMEVEGLVCPNDGLLRITEESLLGVFNKNYTEQGFIKKLKILVQIIYQELFGLGIIDVLIGQPFDSIMGGTSYGGSEERSLWVQYKGQNIHMAFAAFGDSGELERVCRILCRTGYSEQLSAKRGYFVGCRENGSRVVVVRPPFCESWSFFLRQFKHRHYDNIRELFDEHCIEYADRLMKWLIRCRQVIGITGAQGSGKTTLLMYLVGYIPKSYTIRVQEMNFELFLRECYPERNIVSFRETDSIGAQEGLDLQKKTDGTVNILGEVATAEAGSYMIQMGMSASLFTIFTHHATTTEYLLLSLRNCLMECADFYDERLALAQVLSVLGFDIHIAKDDNGKRYIERISEIVPITEDGNICSYKITKLLEYCDGQYRRCERISTKRLEKMAGCLSVSEREAFYEEMAQYPQAE